MTDRNLPVPSDDDPSKVGDRSKSDPHEVATFRADPALPRELGERLVSQPHIALAKLIKNAYVADATHCSVELEQDHGDGQRSRHDPYEFLDHWMTIGTCNKQRHGMSRIFGRNVTASEGVERLSAQFLPHDLEIVTASAEDETNELRALVDWDDAIEAGSLTKAEARFRVLPRTTTFAE